LKLSHLLTRLAAIAAGAVAFCLVLVINVIGRDILEEYLMWAGSRARWPQNWPLVVDPFRIDELFLWGYPACVGLTTTFFFWNGCAGAVAVFLANLERLRGEKRMSHFE
jgi:hypothetical protein